MPFWKTYSLLAKPLFWILLWIAVQLFVFMYYGPKVLVDTQRFVEEANAWRSGSVEASYHFWYSGYIFYLYCFSDPLNQVLWVVAVQVCIALLAFMALLKLVGWHSFASRVLLCIYIFNIPYHQWNICLLTESLFCSFIVFSFYLYGKTTQLQYRMLFIVSVLLVATLRPNGFLLALSFLLSQGIYAGKKVRNVLLATSIGMIILGLFTVNGYTDTFYYFIRNSLASGEYICGYPSSNQVPMSSIAYVEGYYKGTLVRLFHIFLLHPWVCVKLFVLKIVFLLSEVRPFYTNLHNIGALALVLPLYYRVGMHIRPLTSFKLFILLFILLNVLMVACTYTDWDSRFFAALFPGLLCLAIPTNVDGEDRVTT